MSITDLDELLGVAREAADAAAAVALGWREHGDRLEVQEKSASDDLVSQADRDAERAAREVLARHRPADTVVGEEGGADPGTTGVRWSVDPIDGTTSYLYGRSDWSVSVAAVREEDGRVLAGVVAEPALGRTTEARLGGGTRTNGRPVRCADVRHLERALVDVNFGNSRQRTLAANVVAALVGKVRDVRKGGSAAASLAQVATGRSEVYWGPGLQEWDGAAGMLLVSEAGGAVGDLRRRTDAAWPASGTVLAASPEVFEPVRRLIAEAIEAAGGNGHFLGD